jgi:hypothetical protein
MVTDSVGGTSGLGTPLLFGVYADPEVILTANRSMLDLGQTAILTANGTLGYGAYDFTWSGLPVGCSGDRTVTCNPAVPGKYTLAVSLTDSNGFSAQSTTLSLTVYADPMVSLSASRTALDMGQPVTLTASATLGSGDYSYSWSNLPSGCNGEGASISCSPSGTATSSVTVKLTDSDGLSVTSSAVIIVVNAPLASSVALTPTSPLSEDSVTFTATTSGGTAPLAYAWQFGDGANANTGPSVGHAYGLSGTYIVTLWVNDSAGASARRSLVVNVGSTILGLPASEGYAVLGGFVVSVLAVAAAGIFLRRRRKTPPEPAKPAARAGAEAPLPHP